MTQLNNGPNILMIETSTQVGSAAIYQGNEILGYLEYRIPKAHAKLIMPMVQHLIQDAELAPEMLDAIAVSKGPGSYTGLRVGIATAKGVSMALAKPLLAINTLEVLAWQVQNLASQLQAYICPMIDARRMEVYTTRYDSTMNQADDIHAKILDDHAFEEELQQSRIIFVGDGVAKSAHILNRHPNAILMPEIQASAHHLGNVLHTRCIDQKFEDLATFEPFYLKDFVATKPRKKW